METGNRDYLKTASKTRLRITNCIKWLTFFVLSFEVKYRSKSKIMVCFEFKS